MRILIDECLDWRLSRGLPGHAVSSVQQMGWSGTQNGRLLALADAHFDVFITADRNLSFQQNISKLHVAVIVLTAKSTRLKDTMPLMPQALAILPTIQPGTVVGL